MTFFVLGSHPELSIAELKAVLGSEYRPVFSGLKAGVSESVVVIEALDRNLGDLQERLAGIVKVGRIAGELSDWNTSEAADLIASLASGVAGKNKISFGLSVYDLGDKKTTRFLERDLDQLGLEVKKRLKETHLRSTSFGGQAGRPVRYVKGKEPRLSSAIVETNGLLQSGGEYVILVCENKILIGQTEAIQNFKAWSDRDYGRPARDARSGMLPPKLARMMINLGSIEPRGASLLDPFCGSGTVLMEAALMGFSELIGSDISDKAIKDTTTNMKWLAQEFDFALPSLSLHITSAAMLPSVLPLPKGELEGVACIDLLVTEVFLGTPQTRAINEADGRRLEGELLPIFESSFLALREVLKPTGRAVVAFPAFRRLTQRPSGKSSNEKDDVWYRLPLKLLLENLGYRVLDNLLYFREDQLVARDIYVLTRK